MITIDLLKSAVEGLAEPNALDLHPLTTAKFVDYYGLRHPEVQSLAAGEILGRALADLWRQQCLPSTLNVRLKREWNLFLTLEAGYFYPFRHNRRFPGGLAQLGALLLDRDHVALVIADGDEARAQKLQQSEYADFWEMLSPSDKKAALALGISTMAARRDAALRRLAKELEKIEAQAPTAEATCVTNSVTAEHDQPSVTQSMPKDTLTLYREQLRSTTPIFVPEEWGSLIERACTTPRVFIEGLAGSGKTELMRAIARRLCQTEDVPLYLRITDYVSQAQQLDVLQFAARQGWFGQIYREESLRQDFEQQLAEAQRTNRLILLADQVDDLYEEELLVVSQRLAPFQRLILAERTPRLNLPHEPGRSVRMPALSASSAAALLRAVSSEADGVEQQIAGFQQWNLPFQPGFLNRAARAAHDNHDHDHPAVVVQQWISDQIAATRSTGTTIAEGDKARRLLRYLAGLRHDIAARPEVTSDLTRDNVRRAFWTLPITPTNEEQGWSLLDFCCRAGLLQRHQAGWQFTQPLIELALAAEFVIEQTDWVSLRPRHRELMRWTAAIMGRQGTAPRQKAFFQQLRRALGSATRLSALEAADVLAEYETDEAAETRTFKAEVIEQLQGLTQIGSRGLSGLAQRRIDRLSGVGHCTAGPTAGCQAIPAEQLLASAKDLAGVLQQLGLPVPTSAEDRWLEDRRVLSGLIDGLCQATPPDLKRQCAAWLCHAPLSKVVELHVPERHWWKSRARSALEVLAGYARETDRDELTRCLLSSILAQEEHLLQLWQHGSDCMPLVYELLLALDRRMFLTTGLLTKPEWRIVD